MAEHRDMILLGASAGGVEALTAVIRRLPADLPASLFVVLHIPAQSSSVLPQLLGRAGALPVVHAQDGEPIRRGHVYVAPPDHHLLVRRGEVRLGRGPAENGHRPAIDPLFRSAANAYGPRCIGVVLSGSLDDGTAGALAVKSAGGLVVVQDPAEALYPSMPQSTIEHVQVDHAVRLDALGPLLATLVQQRVVLPGAPEMTNKLDRLEREARVAEEGPEAVDELRERGVPSAFACPDCHGVLWELREGELIRYRCRVGHAYLPQSLAMAQSERLEDALWTALRALKESSALSIRLEERARERNLQHVASHYKQKANEASERVSLIEAVLERGRLGAGEPAEMQIAADE